MDQGCNSHFLTQRPYVCQRSFSLYDDMITYTSNVKRDPTFNNTLTELGGMANAHFDPPANATGICVRRRPPPFDTVTL